ncbi:MAG: repressor LexA [Gemmatimonadaceae bacterium]|nr:repressor LexA [Gemmatimonadaceae bacterium]
MTDPLTHIERKVYHYLLDFLAEHTYQPSVREIGRRLRIKSTKTVAELLQSLADKGYLEREPGRSRGVKIVGAASMGGVQPVPLYARVNPVQPYLTSENRERFVQVDRSLVPTDDTWLLRVVGNDMANRGVLAGDWALISPSTRARDGDLVAARIGAHVVVRLVTHLGAVLSLSTATEGAPETFLGPADDFAVLGVVVGVMRAREEPDAGEPGAPFGHRPS